MGILLAFLIPTSQVVLVENKFESLERAIVRTQELGLKNCSFFQGNLEYFKGAFGIGVSLHACGVATDLVLKMCIENKADFVSCPCCYGKVQENHVLSYPRSKTFSNQSPTFEVRGAFFSLVCDILTVVYVANFSLHHRAQYFF